MSAYLLRRVGTSIIVLLGISIFMYLMLHAVFPSPAKIALGLKAPPASIAGPANASQRQLPPFQFAS